MHLIVLAWLYVTLMMAVVEATSLHGTVVGGVLTFVFYGLVPIALIVYLGGSMRRRRAIQARDAENTIRINAAMISGLVEPNAGREAATDPVAPVREEL